ncbi:hypothetical protein SJAV_18320 [Sulfurisphaera javensis]|uniref:Polymerase nucleotidyl transferase domain-containing protein n=1 Tax=Sulfurisphaera javensis TaxID=2049879 RepID=A0AAT9GSN4_9CREN
MSENLKGLCKRASYIGFFGSYARKSDYIEGLSDINVIAISEDKSLLLELASEGYSPIVLSKEQLRKLCDSGDPLCLYVTQSESVCGEFPSEIKFVKTDYTCERLKKSILSLYIISLLAFFREDERSSLENSFRTLRTLIQWRACIENKPIPLSIEETERTCETLGLKFCQTMKDLVLIRRMRAPLTLWSLDKVAEAIMDFMKVVKASKIYEETKGDVFKIEPVESGFVVEKTNKDKVLIPFSSL